MRVLVVEDDAIIAGFVARGLREAGFTVDVAADGSTAFAMATGEPYDLAIVDLMLPGLDSYQGRGSIGWGTGFVGGVPGKFGGGCDGGCGSGFGCGLGSGG